MPKNLGTISDPKDIITKEYLDNKLNTKADKHTTLSGYGITDAYTKNEIDYFVCYNIARDKVFLIPIEVAPSTSISIRFEEPKNHQFNNVIMEDKFLIDNILK